MLPGMPPPAGRRHSHDHRLDVVVRRDGLDARVDGTDLGTVAPAEVMTVEVIARWAQSRLTAALGRLPSASPAARVREPPVALGGFPSAR